MKNCLIAFWLWVWAITAQAAVLMPDTRQLNLLQSAQFLEDPSGKLSLDDVREMGDHFHSWNRGGTELNFGFTSSAYWIRLPLQRTETAPREWLLELHYAKLHHLDFYPPDGPAIYTGSSAPFSSRPYFDRFFVFPLTVTAEPNYFYFRVTSRYALTVPLVIWEPDAYRKKQLRFQALQFMYYGGLIVLALYGLLIYSAIRDVRFLIYCAYIVTAGLGMYASNGLGRQMLWPDAPAFDEISQSAFLSLGAFFVVLFARKLVLLPDDRSWLNRGMQLSQFMFLVTCLMTFAQMVFPISLRLANQLLMLNSVVMGLLVGIASVRAFLHKRQGVRFFMLGWLVLWLGVTVGALRALGWIPSNGITSYAVQLSMVIEMALMALALADLLWIEHQAYGQAQERALTTNRVLLEMSQASEETLKRAVQERTQQLEVSLQLEKSLREQYVRFGSMISHEFRTPLSIIQSQTSLMRKEYERSIDHVTKRLGAIGSATQRLSVMFDKWLHSDSLNHTLEVLEFKWLELQPWLSVLIKTSPHLLLNHAVVSKFHPQANGVRADEYHLGVALTNLIDNAAKYSPVDSTIVIETRLKEGFVGIAVTDQGPGIPQDVQDKVFAEFFRLAPENSVRGVGLGLSIVQRIATAHDGHVELISEPGHGSTFCIWLPIVEADETP